ncbi:hypothetical protein KBZ33_16250 [Cyanobium sp. Cruz-8D1]|uniref:hypothetical protein n=1 Tax=Cyanobium sp. Cruz-8D1 TaxID=2823711 RepID=UPI0020CF5F00|nr:hypothetical protein [Cyanobium sp. Cruz-8D1]MCP9860584.1 hypothetical protein [Cyanobium sp. Cruz-8H5]MCP9867821.1 hypothetical protein [Cyanobium sp. Cruz-8D1]
MEILGRHSRKEINQTESLGKHWLHDQRPVLGAQAPLSASTKTNLPSQTTQDPHTKAVSPLLDPRLHAAPKSLLKNPATSARMHQLPIR